MESEQKPKGIMKSKLVMSFYRAAAAANPPPMQYDGGGDKVVKPSAAPPAAASSSQKVTFNKQRSFGGSDGYVHGPDGGGGDVAVDKKASCYISYVKERRILEELVASNGISDDKFTKM